MVVLEGVLFLLILISVFSIQAAIQTTKSNGQASSDFTTIEEVYVKGDAGLCNSAFQDVNLYVVESEKRDSLSDVRGNFQNIKLGNNFALSVTKIWTGVKAGKYDVLIDCDKDGKYIALEPMTSFNVNSQKGNGSASIGEKNIGVSSWQYDSEKPNIAVEAMQIKLLANIEDIKLGNISLDILGSNGVNRIEVYSDTNNNGKINGDGVLIGSTDVTKSSVVVSVDYTITKDKAENILIAYKLKESAKDNITLSVKAISGEGVNSKNTIIFSGLLIKSGVKQILNPKSCVGTPVLEFEPNNVAKSGRVIAKITNISGCENKKIYLRKNPCDATSTLEIGSCVSTGNECSLGFFASENGTYYVCLDKNNDGDMADAGEAGTGDLTVTKALVNNTVDTIINKSSNQTVSPVTGKTSANLENLLGKNASVFMVVLEITLLLILFVLIIISFKLSKPVERAEE